MTEAKRLRLGVVAAAVVIGYGVAHAYSTAWGVVVGLCAVVFVAAVAALGDQLGRRRTERVSDTKGV